MKKIYSLLVAATLTLVAIAQTYPYSEGFESINNGGGVNGVNGMTASFNVYAYGGTKKGFNGSKAAQFQMSSFRAKDSLTTPSIGPLTPNSQLTFLFRISDVGALSTLDKNLGNGDNIEVLLVSPLGTLVAYTITSANQYHNKYITPTDSFMYMVKYTPPAFAVGQSGQVRFRVNHNTSNADFMFLLDSIVVRDSTAVTAPLIVNGVDTDITCNGAMDGKIVVSATGGTPGYSYNWGGGVTGATRTGLGPGTYTVTVNDNGGQSATKSFTITEPAPLTATATATKSVKCFGGNDGEVVVTIGGGTPGYTCTWSPSTGTQLAVYSACTAGTYSITVTDSKGCTKNTSATVTGPAAALGTSTSSTPATGIPNGTANVTATGGTTPYSYIWSNSQNTAALNGLSPGKYYVTVTDKNGCTKTDSVTVGGQVSVVETNLVNISVQPIPAASMLQIHCADISGNVEIVLSDITGKTVLRKTITSIAELSEKINVATLTNGQYILSLSNEKTKATRNIVIIH